MRYGGEVSGVVKKRRDFALGVAFELFSTRAIEAVNMTDIADAANMGVASLYRYFGTKQELVLQLAAMKWREELQEIDERFAHCGAEGMDPLKTLEFYLDCCITLYREKKAFLRFNANFQNYIQHEVVEQERLMAYGNGMEPFFVKMADAWNKAQETGCIREDLSQRESYVAVICSMLFLAQSLAQSIAWPEQMAVDYETVLQKHKQMLLETIAKK